MRLRSYVLPLALNDRFRAQGPAAALPMHHQALPRSVFVSQAIEGGGWRMLCVGKHGQHGVDCRRRPGAIPGRRRGRRPPFP